MSKTTLPSEAGYGGNAAGGVGWTAVPLKATLGLVAAFVATWATAARFPGVLGWKVKLTVHEPAGGIGPEQVLVPANIAAFGPPSDMPPTVSGAVPVFEMVTVWGADIVPTVVLGNARFAAFVDAMGMVPFPDSATVGFDAAFVSRARIALFAPAVAGENVIATTHDLLTARVAPQPLKRLKEVASLPDSATPEIMRVVVPELNMASSCDGLVVPVRLFPNARLATDT
jgi:hypothetical protein